MGVELVAPNEWLAKYGSAYKYRWSLFEKNLEKQHGMTWRQYLGLEPFEKLQILERYCEDKAPQRTTASLKLDAAVVRSFCKYNYHEIPKSRVRLRGLKQKNSNKLDVRSFKGLVLNSKLRDQSYLTFKYFSLLDTERMLWVNRNSWPQIQQQLEANGHTDKLGNFHEGIIRVDIPTGRKNAERPFFCLVGGTGLSTLRKYLELRGPIREGELIWSGLTNVRGMNRMQQRILRRAGLIQQHSNGDRSLRSGMGLHVFRSLARSLWAQSGASPDVVEFLMGHTLDALGYNRINELQPEFSVQEYRKALPFLDVFSEDVKETQQKQRGEIQELSSQVETLSKALNEKSAELEALQEGFKEFVSFRDTLKAFQESKKR